MVRSRSLVSLQLQQLQPSSKPLPGPARWCKSLLQGGDADKLLDTKSIIVNPGQLISSLPAKLVHDKLSSGKKRPCQRSAKTGQRLCRTREAVADFSLRETCVTGLSIWGRNVWQQTSLRPFAADASFCIPIVMTHWELKPTKPIVKVSNSCIKLNILYKTPHKTSTNHEILNSHCRHMLTPLPS